MAQQEFTLQPAPGMVQRMQEYMTGPGREIIDMPTHDPIQEAMKYALLPAAARNMWQGRSGSDARFDPYARQARQDFNTKTIPELMERLTVPGQAGSSYSAAAPLIAGRDFETQLAAERAKFGQEEEKLRQNELEMLLRTGMTPTFERALMERPTTGKVPQTFKDNLTKVYGPQAMEVMGKTSDWATQAIKQLEKTAKPVLDAQGKPVLDAQGKPQRRQPTFSGRVAEGGLKAIKGAQDIASNAYDFLTTPRERDEFGRTQTEQTEDQKWLNTEGKNVLNKLQFSWANKVKDAGQLRQLNKLLEVAGITDIRQIPIFDPAKNKKGVNQDVYNDLFALADSSFFQATNSDVKNGFKGLQTIGDVRKMRQYIDDPVKGHIPKNAAKKSIFLARIRSNKDKLTRKQ